MSEKQRNVFLAIVSERRVKNISGGAFVRKYRLTSPSSVVSAIRGLLDKDLVTQENNEYFVYGQFFQLWPERDSKTITLLLKPCPFFYFLSANNFSF